MDTKLYQLCESLYTKLERIMEARSNIGTANVMHVTRNQEEWNDMSYLLFAICS